MSSSDNDTISYSTVSNFDVTRDRFGLIYRGYSADSNNEASALNVLKRTGGTDLGQVSMIHDRTYIEDDYTMRIGDTSIVDTVTEVQTVVAEAIANLTATSGEERLFMSSYLGDANTGDVDAVLYSADFDGLSTTSDVASSDTFKVVGIAVLTDVAEASLGSSLSLGNLTNKPTGFA